MSALRQAPQASREMTVPVDYAAAREALAARCPSPRRSQIDDVLYRRADGALARLRRQDTVTRLSCSRPDIGLPDAPETIVLDGQASRRLLELLGFEAVDRVRYVRETWRSCQYLIHLDRVEGLGDFITVQAEQGSYPSKIFRRLALKQLRTMGISPSWAGVDSPQAVPYTASITRAASAAS